MKISAMSDCFRLGFEGGIRKAAEMGLDGVQFHLSSVQPQADQPLEEGRAREIRALLKDCGIVISATCSELGGFNCDGDERKARIERTGRFVRMTAQLGAAVTTAHIGQVPEDKRDPAYGRMRDALGQVAGFCEQAGIKYAVETGPEKAAVLKGLLDEIASPYLGVNLDPANLVMCSDDDPVAATLLLKDYILHTHAKDGINLTRPVHKPWPGAPADWRYIEVPLGQGEVDFPGWIAALRAAGFDGYMAIEREVGETPERDIQKALDFLRAAL